MERNSLTGLTRVRAAEFRAPSRAGATLLPSVELALRRPLASSPKPPSLRDEHARRGAHPERRHRGLLIGLLIGLLFGLLWLPAAVAVAQTQARRSDCEAAAECARLLEQGKNDYKQHRYAAALPSFEKALAQSGDPRVRVLVGRTRFKLGDTAGAINDYTLARPQLVDADDLAKLQEYLTEARGKTAASPPSATASPDPGAAPPGLVSSSDPGEGASAPATAAPKDGKKLKPWAWALIGVAAAAVVATGVGLGVYYGTGTPVPDATVRFP